ncbi:MAG: proton-conducting transporter membrane subunit [Desulfomonilaceae bacterium]
MELFYILGLPLLTAVLSLFPAKNRNFPAALTIGAALLVLAASWLVVLEVSAGAPVIAVKDWLECDAFGGLLLLLVSFVGFTAAIFSWGYTKNIVEPNAVRVRRYYWRYNLFLASMLAVPILAQLTLVWMAVELTTLLSVFLVSFPNTPEAIEAAWKYAVLTCMGAALALFGILMLYWGVATTGGAVFTWNALLNATPNMPPILVETAFLFVLVGFGTKAGLAPLHTWLPDAHSQAPSSVCALLSGVETSTALYCIIRMIPCAQGAPGATPDKWVLAFGLLTCAFAALLLLQARDYKRLLAFSTIEHMGVILAAVGLGGSASYFGAAYQMMSHSFAKSFCFLAAGAVLRMTGTRNIGSIRGLIHESPFVGAALLVGAFAISGAPPFAVFMSELNILRAGISSAHYAETGLLALFIVIAFCGITFHLSRMVFDEPLGKLKRPRLPLSYVFSIVLAGIPVALFGLFLPNPLLELLRLASDALGR